MYKTVQSQTRNSFYCPSGRSYPFNPRDPESRRRAQAAIDADQSAVIIKVAKKLDKHPSKVSPRDFKKHCVDIKVPSQEPEPKAEEPQPAKEAPKGDPNSAMLGELKSIINRADELQAEVADLARLEEQADKDNQDGR